MFHAYQIMLILTADDNAGCYKRAATTKTMTMKD